MTTVTLAPWVDVLVACLMMLLIGIQLDVLAWRRPHSKRCGACGRIVPRGESCHCSRG
jgi:hypothetical protein